MLMMGLPGECPAWPDSQLPTDLLSSDIIWCNRRSTWVASVAKSILATWSSLSPFITTDNSSLICSSFALLFTGPAEFKSVKYITQATLKLCVHTSAAFTLHLFSVRTAEISDNKPGLSGPVSSITVYSEHVNPAARPGHRSKSAEDCSLLVL